MRDPRYIRVEGRPLLIVYRADILPEPRETVERWRAHCRQSGIGDLFLVRVAGNTASDDVVLGSIEYAAAVLKCVLVVVLGHEECGAVKSTIDLVTKGKSVPGAIGSFLQPIVPAVEAVRSRPTGEVLDAAIRENARRTAEELKASQPLLAGLVHDASLKVVAAEYHLHSGKVELL